MKTTNKGLNKDQKARLVLWFKLLIPFKILAVLFEVSEGQIYTWFKRAKKDDLIPSDLILSVASLKGLWSLYRSLLDIQPFDIYSDPTTRNEFEKIREAVGKVLRDSVVFPEEALSVVFADTSSSIKLTGHEGLLNAVFGLRSFPSPGEVISEEIKLIVKEVEQPLIARKFSNLVHNRVFNKVRNGQWAFVLNSNDKHEIDEVLNDGLTGREKTIVRYRFALDGPELGLSEIGAKLDPVISGTRVSQIEAKALRKLRHPSRSRRLRGFFNVGLPERYEVLGDNYQKLVSTLSAHHSNFLQTAQALKRVPFVQFIFANRLGLVEEVATLQSRILQLDPSLKKEEHTVLLNNKGEAGQYRSELLQCPIDELELSVRAYNGLKNSDIRTILDLVTRTEREISVGRNFGKKSLREVKEIVEGLGLQLGMQIPDTDES